MTHHKCPGCDYYYDPEEFEGLEFVDLSFTWTCPACGAEKEQFIAEEDDFEESGSEESNLKDSESSFEDS